MTDDKVEALKILIREQDTPFFSDDELSFYLGRNNQNVEAAAYECLLVKAEDTTLSISGLNTSDTSKYFRRLASRFRPCNTGILRCDT